MFGLKKRMNLSDIDILIQSKYMEGESDPDSDYYVFAYYVHIHNRTKVDVQLLSRHWVITDSDNNVEEIQAKGVMGEEPFIKAGEIFYYNSFCVLHTPVGSMRGSYGMRSRDGICFDADIPIFTLSMPNFLQ